MLDTNLQNDWETIAPGLEVLLRPDTTNEIVALIVFAPLGSAVESLKDSGTVSMTGRLLLRGTKKRSNAELAELIDSMGISLSCDVNDDYSNVHLITTSDTLSESVALLSEVFFQPAFEPEEIEKERQSTLASIRRSEDDLFSLTLKHLYRELYPNHGYGLPVIGTKESVGEITREQLVNSHEELTSGPFKVVAVGNFDEAHLKNLLTTHFAVNMRKTASDSIMVQPPTLAASKRLSISRDSEQAYLVMGYGAVKPTDPDYMAARFLNSLLGDGMSSRLFTALREEKGLAYATGSSYGAHKLAGQLFGYIGTKPESLDTAREGMLAEFERIKTEEIPADEFARTRNYLVGKFLIDHQTNYRRAFYLGHFDMMGLGWKMDNAYPDLISAVTPEQVQAVARKILTEPVMVELIPKKD